ncbi:MAG: helix-turn-helix transcriptional regulator [Saprospiraceae bacterium]|nr:helix-turn-helix transcriptional regulator [Saprospiraceae bacterium]
MPDTALKIRKLRLLREITQEHLAEHLGICIRTYRNIETGKLSPTLRQMQLIAEALNCTLMDLLHFNPETFQFETEKSALTNTFFESLSAAILYDQDIPVPAKIRLQKAIADLLHQA